MINVFQTQLPVDESTTGLASLKNSFGTDVTMSSMLDHLPETRGWFGGSCCNESPPVQGLDLIERDRLELLLMKL